MTEAAKAFVARMQVVNIMIRAGTSPFAALSCGLEDEDWNLIYAAAFRMAKDLEMTEEEV